MVSFDLNTTYRQMCSLLIFQYIMLHLNGTLSFTRHGILFDVPIMWGWVTQRVEWVVKSLPATKSQDQVSALALPISGSVLFKNFHHM